MNSIIMARRFVIIMLSAAIFAFSFSVAVEHAGRSGAQSHFGASFTCAQTGTPYCTTIQ
ncbi:MAG: hypothetical protein QM684_24240 [Rhizobium sp.]|uniref:hypothetical protein n=1 Tax=Rhizobium sp. SYY.PMSO TaxID=3382192 RepID=UPI0039903394